MLVGEKRQMKEEWEVDPLLVLKSVAKITCNTPNPDDQLAEHTDLPSPRTGRK